MGRVGAARKPESQERCVETGPPKKCGACQRWLKRIPLVTFTHNAAMPDGLQINCRECDEQRKAIDLEYGYGRLMYAIRLRGEGTAGCWTFGAYETLMGPDECYWCGGRLSEWGKGHNTDRLNNRRDHTPDNVVAACSPCNRKRGAMSIDAWNHEIAGILVRHGGRGKVQWDEVLLKGVKRVEIPRLGKYEIPTEQTDFFRMLDV